MAYKNLQTYIGTGHTTGHRKHMSISDRDGGEDTSLMEPILIRESSKHRNLLSDLSVDLATKSVGLVSSLPKGILEALAPLVRSMNCYYSNLIEGHNTHPIDIELAMKGDYSQDKKKRNLQLEAKAHIEVQQWIDNGGLNGQELTINGLCELHKRFCEFLPEELLYVTGDKSNIRINPGNFRNHDIQVGNHIAISPGSVPRFLKRFEEAHKNISKIDKIIASATAHHRLLWIHPFIDGNGRVARLMSYAVLKNTLNTGGIWSIARGLARNEAIYKGHLAACDLQRRNDLDGRGNLSEEELANFAVFFLKTCIDQVNFMETLMQPNNLHKNILLWAEEEMRSNRLPLKCNIVLEAILYRGTLSRGEIAKLLNLGERQARRVTSALIECGVIISESTRAPLKIAFPAALASRWMPGLFPEKIF